MSVQLNNPILQTEGKFSIRLLQDHEEVPYDLLLLADETREAIDKYVEGSALFVLALMGVLAGIYVLTTADRDNAEIKNIAIDTRFQGCGLGTSLLHHASEFAKSAGFKALLIGTGDAASKQLKLYKKLGFKPYKIRRNFFIYNYPEPIFEAGVQLKDMIVLRKKL